MEFLTFGLGITWISKLYKKLRSKKKERDNELRELNDIMIGNPLDLVKYYIPPDCLITNPADFKDDTSGCTGTSIYDEIKSFLLKKDPGNQPGNNHMFILSDTGSGKTSLLVILKLLQVTAMIPKKPFFILKVLGRENLDAFEANMDKGNTILLLDALEEDPKAYGRVKERLLEILKKTQYFFKVIVTCRTQFFPEVEKSPLQGNGEIELCGYICQVRYLAYFNDKKVDQYLKKRFPWQKDIFKNRAKIKQANMIIQQMGTLQYRPMLLASIESLMSSPLLQEKNTEYKVYNALLECWLSREESKNDVFKKELFKICEILAVRLSMSGVHDIIEKDLNKLIASISDLQHVKPEDVKGRSLLNRNSGGYYRFAHYSMQEFLVVKYFTDNPHEKPDNVIRMTSFIAQLLVSNSRFKECWRFFEFDHSIFKDIKIMRTIHRAVDMKKESFVKGADMKGVDFRGVLLTAVNFEEADLQVANLYGVDLRNANLSKTNLLGANLQTANLQMVNLEQADLSWADTRNANFQKSNLKKVELQGANLREANFNNADLTMAILTESKSQKVIFDGAILSGANFQGADLTETTFRKAIGKGCNLSFTDLQTVDFTDSCFSESEFDGSHFTETNLRGANFQRSRFHGAMFKGADLSNADFKGANFEDSSFDQVQFAGADFTGANLHGASFQSLNFKDVIILQVDFSACSFQNMNLQECQLTGANFKDTYLSDVNLEETDLHEIQLQSAILEGVNLCKANLQNANLQDASLSGSNLEGANLFAANLHGADLTDVKNITPQMLLETKSLFDVKGLAANVIAEILKHNPTIFDELK